MPSGWGKKPGRRVCSRVGRATVKRERRGSLLGAASLAAPSGGLLPQRRLHAAPVAGAGAVEERRDLLDGEAISPGQLGRRACVLFRLLLRSVLFPLLLALLLLEAPRLAHTGLQDRGGITALFRQAHRLVDLAPAQAVEVGLGRRIEVGAS